MTGGEEVTGAGRMIGELAAPGTTVPDAGTGVGVLVTAAESTAVSLFVGEGCVPPRERRPKRPRMRPKNLGRLPEFRPEKPLSL